MPGSTRTLWMVALTGALLLPASVSARRKQARPKEVEVVKEGKITVVRGLSGGEPQLTDQKDKRWLIVGPLRAEVLRLGGHQLKVWASVGAKKKLMMPTLSLKRYEILDSGGGHKPLVGTLRQTKTKLTFTLERKEGSLTVRVKNRSLAGRLARRVNCKVWIVGEMEGTTLKASKFGWITCKPPKAIKQRKETTK